MATLDWYGTSVLKVRFEDRKWVNRVYFELTNQPLTWRIMYYDYNRNIMVELKDARGNPISGSLGNDPDPDKYIPHKFTFPLTHTNLMELHIERTAPTSLLPGATEEQKAAAKADWRSVAIRNVDFAHEIWHRDQVPPTFDDDVTIRSPLGHVERLLLDNWDASRAIDGSSDTYWQCEPQPAGDAIVPFYLDVRGKDGSAQLIDRLELDPIYPGPSMNVYYSNDDDPATSFQLSNARTLLDVGGTLALSETTGAAFSDTFTSLRLPTNDKMRLDTSRPWTIYTTYRPAFDSTTTVTGNRTLWTVPGSNISLVFDPADDTFKVTRDAPLPGLPTFTRASTAYLDGVEVASGTPRYPGGSAVLVEEGTTNLLTANQASLETDTTGWNADLNVALSRSTEQAWTGAASLALTASAAGAMAAITNTGTAGFAVTAGTVYTASARWRPGSTARGVRIDIRWYDSAGATISDTVGVDVTEVAGTWLRTVTTGTAPTGATYAALIARTAADTAASEIHYLDGAQVEAKGYATSWHPGSATRAAESLTVPPATVDPSGFTIEGDYLPTDTPRVRILATVHIDSGNQWVIAQRADGKVYGQVVAGGTVLSQIVAAAASPAGTWTRWALTESGGAVAFYLDGALVGSYTYTPVMTAAPAVFHVGSDPTDYWQNGATGAVRVSDRVRTAIELADYTPALTADDDTTYLLQFENNLAYSTRHGSFDSTNPTVPVASSAAVTFISGQELALAVGWRKNATGKDEWIVDYGGTAVTASSIAVPSTAQGFVIGNDDAETAHAEGSIRDVLVKQEGYDSLTASAYHGRTDAMISLLGPFDRSRGDWNAIFFAHLTRDVDARVGPGDDFYAFKTWTPIVRDYALTKGVFSLPPTKCKYVKLEFSDLVARPYPVYREGLKRVVKTYPQWVHQWYATVEQHVRQASREAERAATRQVERQRTDYRTRYRTRYSTSYSTTYSTDVTYDYAFSQTLTHPIMMGDRKPKKGETSVRDYNLLHWKPEVGAVRRVGRITDATKSAYTVSLDYYRKRETTQAHVTANRVARQEAYREAYTTTYTEDEQYQQAFNEGFTEEFDVRQTERKRFFRTVRHEYDEREVAFVAQQAYFVAINDVRVLRVDTSMGEDTAEYVETFEDDSIIESNQWGLDTSTDKVKSTAAGQEIVTKTLPSFSNFKTIQIACQGSGWESQFSDEQMSFVVHSHILLGNATIADVAGQITGEGAGRVLRVEPVTPGTEYGIYTEAGVYSTPETTQTYDNADGVYDSSGSYNGSNSIISEGVRTSAVVRLYLPETARGTYELRLLAGGIVRAKTTRKFVPRKWTEVDIPFLATTTDFDFQVAIYQTDGAVTEPFDVDFLGIFQNPIKWEISNDGGTTYKTVLVSMNNPDSYITLPAANNQLKVRITAQRAGVVLQSFVLIPWYIESMLVQKVPIDYITPWGANELTERRAPENKPEFKLWHRFFPQRYSLDQVGSVPTTGQGIRF